MVKSMSAAIAGLRAHQTRMDVLSNNIANVNTWGYKSRTANFQDSMYSNLMKGQTGTVATGSLGGINTSQLGYGAVVSSVSANFSVGSGQYTGNALDCMIDGPGFLMVGTYIENPITVATNTGSEDDPNYVATANAISNSGLLLSRVGILSVDSNGYLVDDNGNYVYGFSPITTEECCYEKTTGKLLTAAEMDSYTFEGDVIATTGEDGNPVNHTVTAEEATAIKASGPKRDSNNVVMMEETQLGVIQIPINPATCTDSTNDGVINDVELATGQQYNIQSWTIANDGTLVGIDDNNTVVTVGKIAVASVQNPNGLDQKTGYYYKIGNNCGTIYAQATTEATGSFKSNYLEMSNVDLASDITTMITTQRGYQANTKIITVTDEMLDELVSMKR